jgi:hypothetical protein
MFVRKVAERVRAQNWLGVVLDFFIVVIGVFVGIQVSNWNQTRIDYHKELQYLRLIERDLNRDVEALEVVRSGIQSHAKGTQLILDSIAGRDTPAVQLEKAFTTLYLTYAYTPQQPTYLGLRNAGQLDLVRDPSLRSSIIDYYEMRQSRFQLEFMQDYDIAQQDLHEHFSKRTRLLPPERSKRLWPAPEDLHWTSLIAPISESGNDIEFLNDLSELGARAGEILDVIEELRSDNETLQDAIRRYVADGS